MMGRETASFGKLELQNYLAENGLELNTWVTSDAAAATTSVEEELRPAAMGTLPLRIRSAPRNWWVENFFCKRKT